MRNIEFLDNYGNIKKGIITEQAWDSFFGDMIFKVEHAPNHMISMILYDEVDKKHKTWTRFTTDLLLREWKKDVTHSFAQAVVAQRNEK